jgi:hypothetical protein
MDSLRAALTKVKDLLDWLPDPLVAVMILGIAVLVALALHRWARKLARRALAGRYPYSLFDIQSDERTESACAFDFGDDRGHSGCAAET